MMTQGFRSRLHAIAATLFFTLFFVTLPPLAARAVEIQEVTSPGGVTAWLVEDYTVPLIAVRFAFEGGSTQDPAGKEGLANLMSSLFDEGAGELDSDAFQERLDDAGAEMSFNAGQDAIYGSMRMLAEQKDEALDLLRLAIREPRFDAAPVNRIRAQIMSGIEAQSRDPQTLSAIAWANALYGGHPYARRDEGTKETLATIDPSDLTAFHQRMFARDNLHVGVVGAIDAETLKVVLDDLFGALPGAAELTPVADVEPKLDQEVRIDYALPQTSLRLAYPGIERDDPRFFAAYLMNEILGGGTFSSRLFEEVREKRGLAYGVGSSLSNAEHATSLVIGTSTRADRADETLDIIREEVRRMATEGPTEAELAEAKKYVIGAYAINNLDTSGGIARTLVELQLDDLGIDYIERRDEIIDAVTLEETKAAAQTLLTAEPAVMILGPAAEVEAGPAATE